MSSVGQRAPSAQLFMGASFAGAQQQHAADVAARRR